MRVNLIFYQWNVNFTYIVLIHALSEVAKHKWLIHGRVVNPDLFLHVHRHGRVVNPDLFPYMSKVHGRVVYPMFILHVHSSWASGLPWRAPRGCGETTHTSRPPSSCTSTLTTRTGSDCPAACEYFTVYVSVCFCVNVCLLVFFLFC